MSALFLSASVPVPGRGNYHESADPFLIQTAVRELVIATIRKYTLVWGGHPSITPMIWSICSDLGVDYANRVVLYQSGFFTDRFPEENAQFGNVVYTEPVTDDLNGSLLKMRTDMFGRADLVGAVFIGGMDGIEAEFNLFRDANPQAGRLVVSAPGGAAMQLANRLGHSRASMSASVDFASLYQYVFTNPAAEPGDAPIEDLQRRLAARVEEASRVNFPDLGR